MSLSNTLIPLLNRKNSVSSLSQTPATHFTSTSVGCTPKCTSVLPLPATPTPSALLQPFSLPRPPKWPQKLSPSVSRSVASLCPTNSPHPPRGLRARVCVPSWGGGCSSERRDRAWCLAQGPSFRRALQGGDQLCHISCRMSLVSQEEPARALLQDCTMLSAELGGKSLGK